jgi:hypothetical protein
MMRMPGNSHTAENIKIAIETMVLTIKSFFLKRYYYQLVLLNIGNFALENTDKISAMVTDQGSYLVRLLKKNINEFIVEEDNIDVVLIEEVRTR